MSSLHVSTWGSGPPVVLVHQSAIEGRTCWVRQRTLGQRWQLLVLDRRGYGNSPPADGEDLQVDCADVVEVIREQGQPVHLAGVSFGGEVSLLAAARVPELVRSLVVIEPSAFVVARDQPEVSEFVERLIAVYEGDPGQPSREFLVSALEVVGGQPDKIPDPMPESLERAVRVVRGKRRDWWAPIPVQELASASFPKLVVSGLHLDAYELVCDRLAQLIGGQRLAIPATHSVQLAAEQFNPALEAFWRSA